MFSIFITVFEWINFSENIKFSKFNKSTGLMIDSFDSRSSKITINKDYTSKKLILCVVGSNFSKVFVFVLYFITSSHTPDFLPVNQNQYINITRQPSTISLISHQKWRHHECTVPNVRYRCRRIRSFERKTGQFFPS